MDKVVLALQGIKTPAGGFENANEYDTAARQYLATLQRLPDVAQQMILHDPKLVLRSLNPSEDSIGYLFVLHLLLHPSGLVRPDLDRQFVLDEIIKFLLAFDTRQIRCAGPKFRNLLEDVAIGSLYPASVAVELLASVILRLDPSGSMFTSAHLLMAILAYNSNCIEPARQIIDSDILFVPKNPRSALSKTLYDRDNESIYGAPPTTVYEDVVGPATILEYQYTRSLIYISRRDWAKAQAALEQLITHPSKNAGLSKIMAEGHKKWVLVGLLNKGTAPMLPSSVATLVKHMYNTLSSAYEEVATLFSTDDAAKLKVAIESNAQTWQDDGNKTLMEEVTKAYQKWQIINLRRIYHRVSISQIQSMTLSAETATMLAKDEEISLLINEMIGSGMLKGELQVGLTGEDSYLTFQEENENITEAEFAAAIAQSHHNVSRLSKQYRATNERFSTNKDYIKHLSREQKMMMEREIPDAGIGFDAHIEDEDLMTGVMSHN